MKVLNIEDEPFDDVVAVVEVWFDPGEVVWVVQSKNARNDQIGSVEHVYQKSEALKYARELVTGDIELKVFTRTGERMPRETGT